MRMNWKSILIAVIALIFVVALFVMLFGGKKDAAAYGQTSTAEAMFPPQYVTAPTPVLVTQPVATQSAYNGVYYNDGYQSGGRAGANPPSYSTYQSPYDSYSYRNRSSANSYPVYRSPYDSYNYSSYSSYSSGYPTYHSPYDYYYSSGYGNYPVYYSPYDSGYYGGYGYGSYASYQSPYDYYGGYYGSNYPVYQSPYDYYGYGGYYGSYNPYAY